MSLNREFLILKEQGRGESERERERWVGRSAVIFKVRLGLLEMEGRDRETEIERHRNKET